jgi:hypothetical protein
MVSRLLQVASLFALAALVACADDPVASPSADLAMSMSPNAATFTDFTGTDIITGLVDPGSTTVTDKHIVMRGIVVSSRIDATDPRVSGFAEISINGTLSAADGTGHVFGKFTIAADMGGTWTGTWTGKREQLAPDLWMGTLDEVMEAKGGAINGLKAHAVETVYTNTLVPSAFMGLMEGWVLDPH